jgi:hypothetical protein
MMDSPVAVEIGLLFSDLLHEKSIQTHCKFITRVSPRFIVFFGLIQTISQNETSLSLR